MNLFIHQYSTYLMSLLRILCCIFSVSVLANDSLTSVDIDKASDGIQDYFELSGINKILQSVPEQLAEMKQDAINEYGENSDDERVLTRLEAAWNYPLIKKQLLTSIKKSLTPEQLTALIRWQHSHLAQVIKLKDQDTELEGFPHDLARFMGQLPASMPDKEHIEVINTIIDAKQMVDDMVTLTLSVSRPVMMALAETETAKKEGLTRELIEAQLFELEQLLYDDLSQQIALMSYYLYKDVPLKQLEAYAQFYQSDLGQLELAILNKVVHQSIALWQTSYEQAYHQHLFSQRNEQIDDLDG